MRVWTAIVSMKKYVCNCCFYIIFCRGLDIRVPQVVDAYTDYPGLLCTPLNIPPEQAVYKSEHPVWGLYTVYLTSVCQDLLHDDRGHRDTPDTVLGLRRPRLMRVLVIPIIFS